MAEVLTSPAKSIYADQNLIPADELIPEALIFSEAQTAPAIGGDAQFVRVPYVAQGPDTFIVNEGEDIPESAPELTEMLFRTVQLGIVVPVSNEAASSAIASGLVSASASRAIADSADRLLLQGTEDPNVSGLLQGSNAMVQGEPIVDSLDPLVAMLAELGRNGSVPTSLIMNYSSWMRLTGLKGADGLPLIARNVTDAATPTLFGISVVINAQVPDDVILANNKAEVYASASPATVAFSDGPYFRRNMTAMRVLMRVGWGVLHRNRLGRITIAPATGKAGK